MCGALPARKAAMAAVINTYELADVLWYNTGITVTTTTAQAITTPTFPARDLNGSSNDGLYGFQSNLVEGRNKFILKLNVTIIIAAVELCGLESHTYHQPNK